jgi:hypothetical protein
MEPRRATPKEKKGFFLCGQPNSLLVPSLFRFQTKVFAPLAFFGVCGDFGAFCGVLAPSGTPGRERCDVSTDATGTRTTQPREHEPAVLASELVGRDAQPAAGLGLGVRLGGTLFGRTRLRA